MEGLLNLKKTLASIAKRTSDRGLQTGNGGNLSARLPGTEIMIIKASGSAFADCDENSWIATDLNGNIIEGEGKPSSEYPVHAAIYRKTQNINSVIHFHSVYTISMAEIFNNELPAVAHHSIIKLGSPIPILDINTPGITDGDLWRVEELFDKYLDLGGIIHKKHGAFALGKNPLAAFYNAELIEETAHIAYCTHILKNNK